VANSLNRAFEESTILVNAVGIVHAKPFIQLSHKEIEDSIKVNILSCVYTCQEFIKCSNALQESAYNQPPYIVNLSSCLGLGGVANMTDYCATKFAVFGLSESLRNELSGLKNNRIKVLTVCPFLIEDSEMFKDKVRIKFPWLMRPLKKAYVAERIIQAISQGKSELWLPWWVNFIGLLRLAPTAWFDKLQHLLGSSEAILLQKNY
jgi:all-trans-retinol dehydrogenase (NAD+)